MNSYQHELKKRALDGLLRKLQNTSESSGVDFFSNDYLGFSRSNQLSDNINKEYTNLTDGRIGSTGSRLLSGNSNYAEELEKKIANYHKVESALIFSSGYSANVGLLSALGKRGTSFISDELIHASMIDGIRLSHAERHKFKHNDLNDLEIKLKQVHGEKIIVIESVYSMDGDIAPVKGILQLCKKYNAQLIVDEAHAIGVVGDKGEGLCSSLNIQNEIMATIVTFGKAMGVHGAAILGKDWLKQYLINFARSFIYSTAPSDHQLASISSSYDFNYTSTNLRKLLSDIVNYFVSKRKQTAYNWLPSNSPIQSLIIPGNQSVVATGEYLKKCGFLILPIRSPSVPKGSERLRISLHSCNTKEEIDLLFKSLEKWHQESL